MAGARKAGLDGFCPLILRGRDKFVIPGEEGTLPGRWTMEMLNTACKTARGPSSPHSEALRLSGHTFPILLLILPCIYSKEM